MGGREGGRWGESSSNDKLQEEFNFNLCLSTDQCLVMAGAQLQQVRHSQRSPSQLQICQVSRPASRCLHPPTQEKTSSNYN